jgi:hypothetical protein
MSYALYGWAGVSFAAFPDLNPLDEEPQELGPNLKRKDAPAEDKYLLAYNTRF